MCQNNYTVIGDVTTDADSVFSRQKVRRNTIFFVKHLCITLFLYTDNDKITKIINNLNFNTWSLINETFHP